MESAPRLLVVLEEFGLEAVHDFTMRRVAGKNRTRKRTNFLYVNVEISRN